MADDPLHRRRRPRQQRRGLQAPELQALELQRLGRSERAAGAARRVALGVALAMLTLIAPAALSARQEAGSAPLALQAGTGSARVTALLTGERATIELPGRRLVDVALGRDAEIASLTVAGDRWLLAGSRVAVDGRRRLAIVTGDDLTWREIPAPPGLRQRARSDAVLLGDPDSLELRSELVLAWLEGDGSQRRAVHAAVYDGASFGEPELVSPAGPGSQLALRGVLLPDGTPLLVWTAFDGDDNEIVWSARIGGAWSAPERIGGDNRVPDVAPQLLATADGALAVWSRYDGRSYRVVGSRFDGTRWERAVSLAGPGTSPARLVADRDGAMVLYERARPGRWAVARLGGDGEATLRVSATAELTDGLGGVPLVGTSDASAVELEWPAPEVDDPAAGGRVRRSSRAVLTWREVGERPPVEPRAGRRDRR